MNSIRNDLICKFTNRQRLVIQMTHPLKIYDFNEPTPDEVHKQGLAYEAFFEQ